MGKPYRRRLVLVYFKVNTAYPFKMIGNLYRLGYEFISPREGLEKI
jgi:hypothetical protein